MKKILFILLALPLFLSCDDKEFSSHEVKLTALGNGQLYGDGVYGFGRECSISVWADSNNGFLGWYENEKLITKEEVYKFEVYEDRQFVAVFTDTLCSVRIYDERSGSGSEDLMERLNLRRGKSHSFTAKTSGSDSFVGWYDENMNRISGDLTISLIIDRNTSLYKKYNR